MPFTVSAKLWQKNKRENWIKMAFQASVTLLKYLESEANEFTFLLKTYRFPNAPNLWKNMSVEYIRGGKRVFEKSQTSCIVHSQKTMDKVIDLIKMLANYWIPLSKCNIWKPYAWNLQTKTRWNICTSFFYHTFKEFPNSRGQLL